MEALITRKLYADLCEVVNYLHADERKHWEEAQRPANHMYHHIHRVARRLDTLTPPTIREWDEVSECKNCGNRAYVLHYKNIKGR